MQATIDYFLNLPFWELLAVFLSIAYVVLVAKNNRWCWPAAFISTLIFTIIFYDVSLLMESLLNVYYMAMAIYGWYRWQNSKVLTADNQLPIITWPLLKHIKLVGSLTVLSLGLGFIMDNYTAADFAYLDTFTTVFAVATTYLVTIKLYENWLYWIVINSLSVFLYLQKGLEPTALLAGFNVIMCIVGLINWYRIYKQQPSLCKSEQTITQGIG
ncbi:nicotinamide riboside transporter PnuC [Thalassomonas sp. M1454]|uniref:nicotinamide riboside transporter PnuC n=1 Tax=Thalassomonas sp. M1454 TaxID=2594477 RepID=UPI00117CD3C4|nr:nicotinamide riboside transporter PnuC [Thalassomonas sp. M1454]TRX56812.1 nicotinamide mononucleotide transporter [Thalassomonas sp. M1454]